MMNTYQSIIDMLNRSISSHPTPISEYQNGFLDGMKESVEEIKIAQNHKE